MIEAKLVKDQDIVLIGAGNSAGQAIVFLANFARSVRVLIRGNDLTASMSKYLIDRINSLSNVTLCSECTLSSIDGDEAGITHLRVCYMGKGDEEVVTTRHLFLFIGADPKTQWLGVNEIALDNRGFVLTGFGPNNRGNTPDRASYALETSIPGIFAIGDVRSASAKRVASAVGDGAAVVSQIHQYLRESTERFGCA